MLKAISTKKQQDRYMLSPVWSNYQKLVSVFGFGRCGRRICCGWQRRQRCCSGRQFRRSRGRHCSTDLIDNRGCCAVTGCQNCQRDRGRNEKPCENPCYFGQRRRRRAARNNPASRPHPQAAAFRALQQDHPNQQEGQDQVDGEDDVLHANKPFGVTRLSRRMRAGPQALWHGLGPVARNFAT